MKRDLQHLTKEQKEYLATKIFSTNYSLAFSQTNIRDSYIIEKGNTSFCDGHGSRYWRLKAKVLKRKIEHFIETFDNDLRCNNKYHCYIDYGGCIGCRTFDTDNFKEAVIWMIERLKNYR